MAKPYKKQPDDRVVDDLTKPGMGAQIRASLMEKNRALEVLFTGDDALIPSGGAAPVGEAYVTIGNTSGLSAERALVGTANQVTVTDGGANGSVTLSSPLAANAYVTIGNTTNLSAERALTGTANQITVTDNGANSTVVLSTPQNLDTAAAFRVGTLAIGGTLTAGKLLDVYGNVRMRDPSNTAKIVDWDLSLLSAGTALIRFPNSASGVTRNLAFLEDGFTRASVGENITAAWTFNPNEDANYPALHPDRNALADGRFLTVFDDGSGGGQFGFVMPATPDGWVHIFPLINGQHVMVGADSDPPAAGFIGKVNRTGQTAVVAATVLVDATGASGGLGYHVVHYTLETTTLGAGAGTIQFQIDYTDDVGATTQVSAALALTATGRTRGTLEVWATAGITYQTNLVGIFGTSQYALRVRCEFLG
jgi:hypothetical protein